MPIDVQVVAAQGDKELWVRKHIGPPALLLGFDRQIRDESTVKRAAEVRCHGYTLLLFRPRDSLRWRARHRSRNGVRRRIRPLGPRDPFLSRKPPTSQRQARGGGGSFLQPWLSR